LAPLILVYYPLMKLAIASIATALEKHLESFVERVDLVHNVRIGREPLSYASMQVARRHRIPLVLTPVHHPRWTSWRYKAYIELYRSADAILALTSMEKQILIDLGVREERIFITGMGPVLASHSDANGFLERHGVDGPMILFLGQHYPYKGYQQVLRAARLVWEQIPQAHFVFIGPPVGRSESYFAAIPDRRIHRLGKVDLQNKTDALAACTMLCVPSTQESFGGVFTEAWSFGKPVIGGNIPAVAEVITDGVDGFLVAQDPLEIAERIICLLRNTTSAQHMGAVGKHKVENRYTWSKLAKLTEHAYQKVM
jgi:glycosyltransferase involved in cell wall biosynthesis